jgi:hypothetical protein
MDLNWVRSSSPKLTSARLRGLLTAYCPSSSQRDRRCLFREREDTEFTLRVSSERSEHCRTADVADYLVSARKQHAHMHCPRPNCLMELKLITNRAIGPEIGTKAADPHSTLRNPGVTP